MRYKSLDGLRGIAAMIVLLHHCLIIVPFFLEIHFHKISNNENNFFLQISHLFWAGHEAVLLFFILSGFVLYSGVQNLKSYKKYILNRFSRIYIPYIVSIILSTSLYLLFYKINLISDHNNMSAWFNTMWPVPIDYLSIISAVFMTGYNTHSINTVTWSLIHELRISLVFPAIVWWVMKNNKLFYFFVSIFIIFISNLVITILIPKNFGMYINIVLTNLNDTFYYIIFFLIGIFLAINKKKIFLFFNRLSSLATVFIFCIGILLFLFEWMFPEISQGKYIMNIYISKLIIFCTDMFISLGIIIIFCLCLYHEFFKKILECNLFVFMGKISYSLYLVHPIVILCTVHLAGKYLNYSLIILSSVLFSLCAGTLFHLIVEKNILIFLRKEMNKSDIEYKSNNQIKKI